LYILGACCLIGAGGVEVVGSTKNIPSAIESTPIPTVSTLTSPTVLPVTSIIPTPILTMPQTTPEASTVTPNKVTTLTRQTTNPKAEIKQEPVTNNVPTLQKQTPSPTVAVKNDAADKVAADQKLWETYKTTIMQQLNSFSDKDPVKFNASVKAFTSEWTLKLHQLSARNEPKQGDEFDLFSVKQDFHSKIGDVSLELGRLKSTNDHLLINLNPERKSYLPGAIVDVNAKIETLKNQISVS
jgi:hypothetical protein